MSIKGFTRRKEEKIWYTLIESYTLKMNNLEKILQKTIEISFIILFALVPLILTPWNYELFEFNKMLTVYLFTSVIFCAWIGKMILSHKIIFRRTFWDIPLLIFFLSQLLSFLFSIDRHTSFWGYYSRFNGGLLSTVSYIILYWAFVSNLQVKSTNLVIKSLLTSTTFIALYGIAERLGIDEQLWIQDVRHRVFATLGQPNWLAAWLTSLLPFTLILCINALERKNWKLFLYQILIFGVFYLCLLFTRSRSGILGFATSFFVFWLLILIARRKNWKKIYLPPFLLITIYLLITTLLFAHDWLPPLNKIKFFQASFSPTKTTSQPSSPPLVISESGNIRRVVWKGAIEIWRHYPLFGTGPETFAYAYYWFRPREHNDLSEWDFLYNKAHNEYLNYGATSGTVGFLSYLLIIFSFLIWFIKIFQNQFTKNNLKISNSKQKISPKFADQDSFLFAIGCLSGFVSLLVTNFFGFSVVPTQLLFFTFPAFILTLLFPKEVASVPHSSPLGITKKLAIGGVFLVLIYNLAFIIRYWRADYYFAQGEKLDKIGKYQEGFAFLQKAINLRNFEPIYHDELAWNAANLAFLSSQQKDPVSSAQLAKMAIEESNKALTISPYHLNFWKTRAKIFFKLASLNPYYYQESLKTLLRAKELAPTDPKIRYNLGLVYFALGENQKARQIINETINLKPDYEDPHYLLALIYQQEQKFSEAREELEYILNKINPLSQRAKEELEKIKK